MKYIIKKKQSNTGSIHDLASDQRDRVIEGRGKYAVVLAAYYGGKGYTTHETAEATIKAARQVAKQGYSYQIIDENGSTYGIYNEVLVIESFAANGVA
jgi:phage protein U